MIKKILGRSFSKYIIALDQGTTSSRAVLFNSECKIVAMHQKEHKQITPQPGWVEHNPQEIFESVMDCASNLLIKAKKKHHIKLSDISCLGITNQRETTVAWVLLPLTSSLQSRKTGLPLHNAIVWLDSRTFESANQMISSHGNDLNYFKAKCGLPIHSYFSALKMKWLLKHSPRVALAAKENDLCFGTIDSWLIYVSTSID